MFFFEREFNILEGDWKLVREVGVVVMGSYFRGDGDGVSRFDRGVDRGFFRLG